jgi:hypothetical protein
MSKLYCRNCTWCALLSRLELIGITGNSLDDTDSDNIGVCLLLSSFWEFASDFAYKWGRWQSSKYYIELFVPIVINILLYNNLIDMWFKFKNLLIYHAVIFQCSNTAEMLYHAVIFQCSNMAEMFNIKFRYQVQILNQMHLKTTFSHKFSLEKLALSDINPLSAIHLNNKRFHCNFSSNNWWL